MRSHCLCTWHASVFEVLEHLWYEYVRDNAQAFAIRKLEQRRLPTLLIHILQQAFSLGNY